MSERKICLTIAFDGTDFQGWQVQASGRTVQGVLEDALESMHRHPVRLTGAGRTDAGVHARAMSAHFTTDIFSIPAERFIPALNSFLPRDVRVTRAEEVSEDFHARYDAVAREYRYFLSSGTMGPLQRRGVFRLGRTVDIDRLNRYAATVVGIHDFTTFSAAGDKSDSKVRRIDGASWYPQNSTVVFVVKGNAFLWRMVRSLVGTMVDLDQAGADPSVMADLLASRDRSRSGMTIESCGLYLWRVYYA